MGITSCPIGIEKRNRIDSVVRNLHEDQSGGGRHKCSYCAYEKGFEEGYEKAKKQAAQGSL